MSIDNKLACHSIALEVAKKFSVGDDIASFAKNMTENYVSAFEEVSVQLKPSSTKATMEPAKRYY